MLPHGRGELLVMGTSSQTFHGTWKNGKLVTPLTDLSTDAMSAPSFETDPEPVTEDEKSKSSSEEPLRKDNFLQGTPASSMLSTKITLSKQIWLLLLTKQPISLVSRSLSCGTISEMLVEPHKT